jgi:hypothetical protein
VSAGFSFVYDTLRKNVPLLTKVCLNMGCRLIDFVAHWTSGFGNTCTQFYAVSFVCTYWVYLLKLFLSKIILKADFGTWKSYISCVY